MTQLSQNPSSPQYDCDVLVIGGGAAGLSLALRLADSHRICLISKGILTEASTLYAQGGIAAVQADDDSIESHINDTIDAGAGLCEPDVVKFTVENAKECIQWLIDQGISFTENDDGQGYHLTREGGHSHRRVIHATDATGRAVETTLEQKVRAHPNIHIHEQHIAVDSDREGLTVYDINGWLHPVYLTARISLGITLDFD